MCVFGWGGGGGRGGARDCIQDNLQKSWAEHVVSALERCGKADDMDDMVGQGERWLCEM